MQTYITKFNELENTDIVYAVIHNKTREIMIDKSRKNSKRNVMGVYFIDDNEVWVEISSKNDGKGLFFKNCYKRK